MRFRLSRQTHVSGHPGSASYSGRTAPVCFFYPGSAIYPGNWAGGHIRANGQRNLSWQTGKSTYPGKLAMKSTRANGQSNLSGHMQPIQAMQPIRADIHCKQKCSPPSPAHCQDTLISRKPNLSSGSGYITKLDVSRQHDARIDRK